MNLGERPMLAVTRAFAPEMGTRNDIVVNAELAALAPLTTGATGVTGSAALGFDAVPLPPPLHAASARMLRNPTTDFKEYNEVSFNRVSSDNARVTAIVRLLGLDDAYVVRRHWR